jgi:hypothetical protein
MKLARELANKKRRWKKGWKEPTEESKQLSAHVITNAIRIRVAKLTVTNILNLRCWSQSFLMVVVVRCLPVVGFIFNAVC